VSTLITCVTRAEWQRRSLDGCNLAAQMAPQVTKTCDTYLKRLTCAMAFPSCTSQTRALAPLCNESAPSLDRLSIGAPTYLPPLSSFTVSALVCVCARDN